MEGKFFDDWTINEEFITPGRTITETDVVMFAAMTGDYNELHTNKELMKNREFGQRIAHGLLGMTVAFGLMTRAGLFEGVAIAVVNIENWKFKSPIFFGDTIHVKLTAIDKKTSKSKPDRGVVKLFAQVINQDGIVVQEGARNLMFKRKV